MYLNLYSGRTDPTDVGFVDKNNNNSRRDTCPEEGQGWIIGEDKQTICLAAEIVEENIRDWHQGKGGEVDQGGAGFEGGLQERDGEGIHGGEGEGGGGEDAHGCYLAAGRPYYRGVI